MKIKENGIGNMRIKERIEGGTNQFTIYDEDGEVIATSFDEKVAIRVDYIQRHGEAKYQELVKIIENLIKKDKK